MVNLNTIPEEPEISEFKLPEADRFIPVRTNNEEEELNTVYETKMLIECDPPQNLFEEGKTDAINQNN